MKKPLETYLHPDSQFSDVTFLSSLLVIGVSPVCVKPSCDLGGEAVTSAGGNGKLTVIPGNVEWLAANRAFGFVGSFGNV